jgi:hypothetical protein
MMDKVLRWFRPAEPLPGRFNSRMFRLFHKPDTMDALLQQVEDLRSMLISVIEDVDVMQEMLRERGVWDEQRYRELRFHRMVEDQSGRGPAPWQSYSYYRYTLEDEEFIRDVLGGKPEAVDEFRRRVEHVRQLT